MKSSAELRSAYVLHTRPFKETSLLLEVLTDEYGRIGLVAKGARRGKSPHKALLQLFQPLLIAWRSRGELATLVDLEADGVRHRLVGERLISGFYLNELIVRLLARNDPTQDLFTLYQQTLRALECEGEYESSLRIFEKRFLDVLGYGLNLDFEISTGKSLAEEKLYCYDLEEGPRETESESGMSLRIKGSTLIALKRGELQGKRELVEAKKLLRAAINRHLGGTDIRSRDLFIRSHY